MGYGKEDESEEKVYQEYGVANLNDTIKNQYSEDVYHVRLGINKQVDSYTASGESETEYTSIDYMLQIKLYYGEDYGYEDDYDTPGLGLVNIIINNSTGAILSESESGSIVFSDSISEESYFFDEFEELFDSDIEDFGDQLKTEFNNAINSFEKDWVNSIKSDKDFKIELEKLFDFNKILTRLKEYQVKIIEKNIVVDSKKNQYANQLEIVKTFNDDKTLLEEYQINTKQEKDGYYRIYYPNGKLKVELSWTNGLQDDGDVISYHDDGSKARQVTLVNHLMNGNYFEWYKNGQLKTQGIYNDKIPTILKQWDENGTLIKQMKFNNETLRTAVKEWLEDNKKAIASYGHISDWDTSEVTDMSKLFLYAHKFNEPLNNWDVSNVTDMESMFYGANSFNQPIGDWDVSKVTSMRCIFFRAISFNRPIGDWDVSKVTNMMGMFGGKNLVFYGGSSHFNQDIGGWNVSQVITMKGMFLNAISFNQPIGDWDVSNVTDMSNMFYNTTSFNQPIGDWDVSNVTDMSDMFSKATSFKQPLNNWNNNKTLRDAYGSWIQVAVKAWLEDNKKAEAKYGHISDWDTSEVTDMSKLFLDAHTFNEPLNNWDVSNVTDMGSMFYGAKSFNQPIGDWDVSNVTDMSDMFSKATSFNQPIGDWDVSNVTDMSDMFSKATSFNQPIGNWDVSKVTDVSEMFEIAAAFNQDIGSWNLKGRIDHDIECKGTLFFTLKDGSEISISVERHALIEYVALHEDGVWYMADEPNFLDSMFLTTSVTPQSIIEIADIKKLFDYDTYDEYDWNGSGGGDCKTLKEWNDFKSKLSRVTSKDQLYFKKHNDK